MRPPLLLRLRASSGGAASATVAAEAAPTVAAALAQAAQPWLPALELTLSFLSRARTPREAREKESGRGAATGVAAASPEATVGRPVRIDPERGLVGYVSGGRLCRATTLLDPTDTLRLAEACLGRGSVAREELRLLPHRIRRRHPTASCAGGTPPSGYRTSRSAAWSGATALPAERRRSSRRTSSGSSMSTVWCCACARPRGPTRCCLASSRTTSGSPKAARKRRRLSRPCANRG
eukprot:1908755-Prymnesium_polylepis.1